MLKNLHQVGKTFVVNADLYGLGAIVNSRPYERLNKNTEKITMNRRDFNAASRHPASFAEILMLRKSKFCRLDFGHNTFI